MSFGKTINLGNSIIGVSILAMPYCFVQSGLLLSILLIVFSGFLTRLSCHLLLKSAFLSKRRSFELMVQDVIGPTGRILVELGLIGFLLGTCVAYFIMIGDLAPEILVELLDTELTKELRVSLIIILSILVALPLSLLKRVDSLTSLSILSLILYSSLILKLMFETTDKVKQRIFVVDKEIESISYWNSSGLLTTFPIFSMAMSCQTSLFEIFDNTASNCDLETMRRDNTIIKRAIYMCSLVYIIVGFLGYMAFHEQTLYGNILLAFSPSFTTTLTKIGFVVSLLLSFPLCLFPCRTSVYSLTIGKLRASSVIFKPLPINDPHLPNDADIRLSKCDSYNDAINNNDEGCAINHHGVEWVDDKVSIKTCGGKFHHNITLPIAEKSSKIVSSNVLRLQTVTTSNDHTTYSYTKLLSDDDELSLDRMHLDNGSTSNGISSLYSDHSGQQPTRLYMSDLEFKILTVILITLTVALSLLFPHIEFILGIIGSTAGTTVCFVLPAFTFLKIGTYTPTELYLARLLLTIGLAILVFCTYSTIHNADLSMPTSEQSSNTSVPYS